MAVIIDERSRSTGCVNKCIRRALQETLHDELTFAVFEEWHSTIKLYIRTFTIVYLLLREILLLRSSTVRHYRNENHSGEGNDDTETKASRIAYKLFSAIVNSIPSYEISIIIFVYIYIYMTNIRIETLRLLLSSSSSFIHSLSSSLLLPLRLL